MVMRIRTPRKRKPRRDAPPVPLPQIPPSAGRGDTLGGKFKKPKGKIVSVGNLTPPKRKRKPRRDAPPVPLPQVPNTGSGRTIKIGNIKRKTKKAPKLGDLRSAPPKGPLLASGMPKTKLKKGPARSRKPRAGQEVPMARKRRAVRRRRLV